MSDHSFSKEIFPNIQSKPPLVQLEAIASCMSISNQENSITAPHDLCFFLEGVSAVSNLSSSTGATSHTPRSVTPCATDFPPVPDHGLPLFHDPTCSWLGWSGTCRLCVVLQVGQKVGDHCGALQMHAPFTEDLGSKERQSKAQSCVAVPPRSLIHRARDAPRVWLVPNIGEKGGENEICISVCFDRRLGCCNTQSSFLSSPGNLYKPVELLWSSTSDSLRRIKWSTMRG